MKKLIFKDLQNNQLSENLFQTQELADSFLESVLEKEHVLGFKSAFWSPTILEGVETRLVTNVDNETLEEIIYTEYLHPAEYTFEIVDDKSQELQALYDSMNEDIYSQMNVVFGTTKSDSAQAYKDTWELMISKPELFTTVLNLSQAEVIAFAQNKMQAVEQYAVYRIQRIAQYQIAKAQLLA